MIAIIVTVLFMIFILWSNLHTDNYFIGTIRDIKGTKITLEPLYDINHTYAEDELVEMDFSKVSGLEKMRIGHTITLYYRYKKTSNSHHMTVSEVCSVEVDYLTSVGISSGH